jgi:hypothetical protein
VRAATLVGLSSLLAAAPAGAADAAAEASPGPRLAFSQLHHQGQVLDVEWQLPAATPWAWLLLQHGFMRRCANLRSTAAQLARSGVATLCVNTEHAAGQPALVDAVLGQLLAPQARAPDGRPRPGRVLVGGHSAGALFAARVGAALQRQEPPVLAGALLFDPVGGAALGAALSEVAAQGRRPVLALMAPALKCNAQHLARPALQGLVDEALAAPAGVPPQAWVWPQGATHVDVEAEDTEAVAVWACGDGWPRPAIVQAQRHLSATWLQALQLGLAPEALAARVQAQVQGVPETLRPVPLLDSPAR